MPPKELVFQAFNMTSLSDIKVIILGQDPYHDHYQANGLAFSVARGVNIPRSLMNIFFELRNDLPYFSRKKHVGGCLQSWAKQGVFLLNTTLTVELHKPNSHARIGWSIFTDKVIELISIKNQGCVFMLWGYHAHQKESLIDKKKHLIIKSAHPSPYSAHNFFGSKCFSKANNYLTSIGKAPIDWSLRA